MRKVAKHISEEPRRFVMGYYCNWGAPGEPVLDDDYEGKFADCGTAACIAGWASILSGSSKDELNAMIKFDPRQVGARAQDLLGLTVQQRENLFYVESWPSRFKLRWYKANTASKRANCGVARIEHFIKTKGKE